MKNKNKKSYSQNQKSKRKRIEKLIREIKETSRCVSCGETHQATLDFHHKNREDKLARIASLPRSGWPIGKVYEEISKCVILCSNCHRKLHWKEQEKEFKNVKHISKDTI